MANLITNSLRHVIVLPWSPNGICVTRSKAGASTSSAQAGFYSEDRTLYQMALSLANQHSILPLARNKIWEKIRLKSYKNSSNCFQTFIWIFSCFDKKICQSECVKALLT